LAFATIGASSLHFAAAEWPKFGPPSTANISRWKRVVCDGLRFLTGGRQATEVAIAADVLNRMLELGRPEYVRIA
jgi:hypothetical protein